MARPKIADRSAVRSVIVTLKLSEAERQRLSDLVKLRADEIADKTGQQIDLSASAFIRWLLDERADAVGLTRGRTRTSKKIAMSKTSKLRHRG